MDRTHEAMMICKTSTEWLVEGLRHMANDRRVGGSERLNGSPENQTCCDEGIALLP